MSVTLSGIARTRGYIDYPGLRLDKSQIYDKTKFKYLLENERDPKKNLALIFLCLPACRNLPDQKIDGVRQFILDELTMFFINHSGVELVEQAIKFAEEMAKEDRVEKWAALTALKVLPYESFRGMELIIKDHPTMLSIGETIYRTIMVDEDPQNVQAAAEAALATKNVLPDKLREKIKTSAQRTRQILERHASPSGSDNGAIQALLSLESGL
jgi:hypothetical protein